MSKFAFLLREPRDLLAKLDREFDRFCEATSHLSKNHRCQSDFAFNFAITAWHLTEWIWKSHEAKSPDQSVRFGARTFQEFRKVILGGCPELRICRDLANGAKHFRLDRSNESTSVRGSAAQVIHNSGIFRSISQSIMRPIMRPVVGRYQERLVVVLSSGQQIPAAFVFEKTLQYWKRFFEANTSN